MTMMQTQRLSGRAVWKGADFDTDSSWIHHLSARDIDDIDRVMAGFDASGATFPDITAQDEI